MNGRTRALVAVALAATLAAGCSDKGVTTPSPTSGRAVGQFTAQAKDGRQVDVEVLSLTVADDLAELRVLVTPVADESTTTPKPMKVGDLWQSWGNTEAMLSDVPHHTAYTVVRSGDKTMASPNRDQLAPGTPYLFQAWFPAPPDKVVELDVTVDPSWPRVLRVPVVRDAPTPDPRATLSVSDFAVPSAADLSKATKEFQLDTRPASGRVWPFAEYARVEPLATADADVVTLSSDILFATDSSDLSAAANQAITDLVADLPPGNEVRVDGHTDGVRDDAYNDALSLRRAQAVADAITAVRPDLPLVVTGHGKRRLKVPESGDDIAEARAKNRRVELTLGGAPQTTSPPAPAVPSPPRTGTSPVVLVDPGEADLLPGAKAEVQVTDRPGAVVRFEVEQVKVRGALTQVDVIVTLVDPPDQEASSAGISLFTMFGSLRPALVDRSNLLRYPELRWNHSTAWTSQGDRVGTRLNDGRPHRFRWTFPALVAKTDKVDLLIDSQIPELTGLTITFEDQ